MNWNLNFSLNRALYLLRTTLFFRYKYHCNICGYPTNDINKLHAHGLSSHTDIMKKHLIVNDNYSDDDNCV